MHLRNIIVLPSDHGHVSATHVAIFSVVRTRIQLQITCRKSYTVKMSYNFRLNLRLKENNIAEYKILGDKIFTRGV
jgi:hypothetical protein